ncbi:hypothetical protein THAOC_29165, partial [Thalassiosira oceanica]
MSFQEEAVDCNALEATTSIEEITEDEINRDILRWLKSDEVCDLWLCRPGLATELGERYELNSYELGSSRELYWLGHLAKKSASPDSIGIFGVGTFGNCSGHSVDRFFDDLCKCNHIKKMHFDGTDLAEIIDKLDGAMKSNNFTHFVVEECQLGVPEATFLFDAFGLMNSLEDLIIDCEEEGGVLANLNDGDMADCIPSLAACSGMRSLKLNYLNLRTNSCAALGGVFPRMATLLKLVLRGNSLDDDCTRLLAQGLSDCKQIESLDLSGNRISDNGLDVLVQSLPKSVYALHLARNDIALARHVRLLRFEVLNIGGNTLCPGGTGVIAASLANPECRLECLYLSQCNIGDEETAILADGLCYNQRLTDMSLGNNNITERGWNAFSSILCDASSINATYNSNHTLQHLGYYRIPQDVEMMLRLNNDKNKSHVAANKILQSHPHLNMRPLFGRELGLLPYVVAWLEHFAKSRPDLKLSSIFDFVRAMPMKVANGVDGGGRAGDDGHRGESGGTSDEPLPRRPPREEGSDLGDGWEGKDGAPVLGDSRYAVHHPECQVEGCRFPRRLAMAPRRHPSGTSRGLSPFSRKRGLTRDLPLERFRLAPNQDATPRRKASRRAPSEIESGSRAEAAPSTPVALRLLRLSISAAQLWMDALIPSSRRDAFLRAVPRRGGGTSEPRPALRGPPCRTLSVRASPFGSQDPGASPPPRGERESSASDELSRCSLPGPGLPPIFFSAADPPSHDAAVWPQIRSPSVREGRGLGPGSEGMRREGAGRAGNQERIKKGTQRSLRSVPTQTSPASDLARLAREDVGQKRRRRSKSSVDRSDTKLPSSRLTWRRTQSSHCLASGSANSTAALRPPRYRTPHSFMSSQAVDCNILEATTSIEDITENEHNRDILRTLQNDELSELWLCTQGLDMEYGEYGLGSSRELDWLGHFAKKSTRLESFGIMGDTFVNCSGHSVDRFLDDLGKCNHVKKMHFASTNLAGIIYNMGPAMKSNNFTHFFVKGCHLGVPEANFLFNTFGDMSSLEELCIECEGDLANLNDGDLAGCIPSIAACTGMRSLVLTYLNLGTNSCAALRDAFPRMANLRELVLSGNSLDDDCTRLLAQGLSECKQIQSLFLSRNIIRDDGLDVLIQSLPMSVDALYLARNDITLTRYVLLLRIRVLNLWGNTLCPGGTRVIAESLADPECRLESLNLNECNIGDEETATLADGLRNNQRLTDISLEENNITERGWNAFSPILCDTSSIEATYNSNHTLQ